MTSHKWKIIQMFQSPPTRYHDVPIVSIFPSQVSSWITATMCQFSGHGASCHGNMAPWGRPNFLAPKLVICGKSDGDVTVKIC